MIMLQGRRDRPQTKSIRIRFNTTLRAISQGPLGNLRIKSRLEVGCSRDSRNDRVAIFRV